MPFRTRLAYGLFGIALACGLLACQDVIPAVRHDQPTDPVVAGAIKLGPPAPATSEDADKLLAAKDDVIFKLETALAKERNERGVIQTERDRLAEAEDVKATRRQALYVSWLAGFGFFASVVAFVLFAGKAPWVGRLTFGGAVAALVVLALARVVSWLAPYLFIVGCSLTGLGVLAVILYLWRSLKANAGQIKLYEKVKPIVENAIGREARLALQVEHVGKSSKIIDTIRSKLGIT